MIFDAPPGSEAARNIGPLHFTLGDSMDDVEADVLKVVKLRHRGKAKWVGD